MPALSAAGKYRPDIDGLRAIAVVAVIVFHLNPPWLPGGFVGVDVFFVISGYLITNLVRREIRDKSFSFGRFYLRRIRRLWPAIATLTLVTAVAAFFILLPRDFHSLSKSILSQPLAIQNVSFMIEGEYFRGSETKPLLHTWSLGVEEQFYMLWPAILVFCRNRLSVLYSFTGLLVVASIALGLLLLPLSPKASFFLLPARAWELGIGACLVFFEERKSGRWNTETLRSVFGGLGLVGVIASFLVIDSDMPFPGLIATMPVVSTALVIFGGRSNSGMLYGALGHRSMVYVGRLSYSLYLWHWPVIVFARHLGVFSTTLAATISILLLSALLSVASFEFVEQPVRHKKFFKSTGRLLWATGLSALLLVGIAQMGLRTEGAAFRYDEPAKSMLTAYFDAERERCGFWFRIRHPTAAVCSIHTSSSPKLSVLLWGNSHADMWSSMARSLAKRYHRRLFMNARNCRPIADSEFCNSQIQTQVLGAIKKLGITRVILASSWRGEYGVEDDELQKNLLSVVDKLAEMEIDVFLVVDIPKSDNLDPQQRYELDPENPTYGNITVAEFEAAQHAFEASLLAEVAADHLNVHVIDPTGSYCFSGHCYGGAENQAWYHDNNHLTNTGASISTPLFEAVFK